MIANLEPQYFTPEEYLEWEERQEFKHEYVNGEVYAMTGGTIPHNDIAVNLTTFLRNCLRGKGCKVSMVDAKVSASELGPFFYPDIAVTCDERDRRALKFLQYPCLIAEVLSPSTEGYDRGDKFKHYRRIATLKEYLLISAEQVSVECFRLSDRGIWELYPYSEGEEIHLTTIDLRFPISLLYEDVEMQIS
jgi:Uma2 family endonuclease